MEEKKHTVLFSNYGYEVIKTVEDGKPVYMIRSATIPKLTLPELGAFACELLFHALAELGRES